MFDGQHVEHHFDIAHRIDVAVEVDVAVDHACVRPSAQGSPRGSCAACPSGTRASTMASAWASPTHDRSSAERLCRSIIAHCVTARPNSRPCGIGQREVTRGEHPAVFVDPRGDGVIGILRGLAVEFDSHAREHPRVVVGIQRVDAEALAVGVDARRIEDRAEPSEGIVALSVKSTSCGSTR